MYRILLAESDPFCRLAYRKMKVWEEYGFEISAEAVNGREALRLIEKEPFDLLISDIKMPVMGGIELLRTLRSNGLALAAVYISSRTEYEYIREAMILGAMDFLKKPASEEAVSEMLLRVRRSLGGTEKAAVNSIVARVMEQIGADTDSDIFLYNVSLFLSENICRAVTMTEAAENLNMSRDYFGKCFKRRSGKSFNTVYTMIKMEYAKTLIDSGRYRNYEISEKLGICDPDYFTKLFKSVTGMTPTGYKNRT